MTLAYVAEVMGVDKIDHSWKEVGVFSESFRGVKGVSGRAFLMRLFRDFSKGDE